MRSSAAHRSGKPYAPVDSFDPDRASFDDWARETGTPRRFIQRCLSDLAEDNEYSGSRRRIDRVVFPHG
jgi:hypothetical protein